MVDQMDIVANNVVNSNNTGYGAEKMTFREYLVGMQNGKKLSYSAADTAFRDLTPGDITATDRTFDVAVPGNFYMTVDTPLGPRYTKAGNFMINAENNLVTKEGYLVTSADGQPIIFEPTDKDVSIRGDGSVLVGDQQRGTIGVVQFANEYALERVGNGYYKTNQNPQEAVNFKMIQGVLEKSNVNPIAELTDMMTIKRRVASVESNMNKINEMQNTAIKNIMQQQG